MHSAVPGQDFRLRITDQQNRPRIRGGRQAIQRRSVFPAVPEYGREYVAHHQWLRKVSVHSGVEAGADVVRDAFADMAMMVTVPGSGRSRARISRAAVMPSITGIMISMQIAS